jgi:hypothetical protein
MLTLDAAIESIEDVLDSQFVQDWYEEGIPSFESLHFKNGNLMPYICVQYADLVQGIDRAMAGTRGDAHDFPVRFIAVSSSAKVSRQIRNKLIDKFTGFSPDYCGEMVKRGGGGAHTVVDDNGAVVAYIAPAMFRTSLTLFEVPDPTP